MKRVAFTAFPGVQALDISGPWEVFAHANQLCGGQAYELILATPTGESVGSDSGFALQPSCRWAELEMLDTLLIPGGTGIYNVIANPLWMNSLSMAAGVANRVASVCTGAFALAELGLLDGCAAVTHWEASARLQVSYPNVLVQNERLYCFDQVWSSAGVSAGMDMALALIEEDHDTALAHMVSKWLVLFLRRYTSDPQLGPALQAQAVQSRTIARAEAYIANHPQGDLHIAALAKRSYMSKRNFARVFTQEVGMSPGRYVQKTRLAYAVRCLEHTDWSVEEIATESGLGSRESLRRAVTGAFGVSPSMLRQAFSQSKS